MALPAGAEEARVSFERAQLGPPVVEVTPSYSGPEARQPIRITRTPLQVVVRHLGGSPLTETDRVDVLGRALACPGGSIEITSDRWTGPDRWVIRYDCLQYLR